MDELSQKVCDLIEAFGIGALILDEIQLLNLASQRAGTDNALLKIINTTGVGLICVGTKDALDRFNSELHLARRLGKLIDTDTYCESYDFFEYIIMWLSKYQWTQKKTRITEKITKALYEETGGIIDMIISLWKCIQIELMNRPDESITVELVKDVAHKYYPGFWDVIHKLGEDNKQRWIEYEKMRILADKSLAAIQADIKCREKAKEIVEVFDEKQMLKREALKDAAAHLLSMSLSINDIKASKVAINASINAVMVQDEFMNADAQTIATQACKIIKAKEAKPKRKRAKAGSENDLMTIESLRESEEMTNAETA